MKERAYEVVIGNQTDPDGDYRAAVHLNGAEIYVVYRKDRTHAITNAEAWAKRHAGYDPGDRERIALDF